LADQENPKPPADLIYEDTGAMAPLVYFDIVGAYGTMNGAIEARARHPHSRSKTGWLDRSKIPFLRTAAVQRASRLQSPQRPRCRAEDAGAAAGRPGRGLQDELTAPLAAWHVMETARDGK
jgi:hypothetical protein